MLGLLYPTQTQLCILPNSTSLYRSLKTTYAVYETVAAVSFFILRANKTPQKDFFLKISDFRGHEYNSIYILQNYAEAAAYNRWLVLRATR